MRVALVQLNSSDDPADNLPITLGLLEKAAAGGATFVLTPEVTNCVSADRGHQWEVLRLEADDETLKALRNAAARLHVWLLVGSLALKSDEDGRFVNRSFLIGPDGVINARYDKIHMFDVALSKTEIYRESAAYRPGDQPVLADVDGTPVGMTVCYDVRFPHLYRDLAKAGAQILTVPSAFAPATGAAHWETLLRARAIENGAFVLAPAQCGSHGARVGRSRQTHGHSLAVGPWGEVLLDGGSEPGVFFVDLDLEAVADARGKVPSLLHDRGYREPE